MGVTGLWSILSPVKKHRTLTSLQGQTLAVDLSIWVCENQGVRQMQNRVLKPHLRNLFFRISSLLQLGIKPVFVIEGQAPDLKHEEMSRRLQSRHRGKPSTNTKKQFGRGRLQSLLRECCELLDALGVPYVQSQGEAESTCAALNAAGLVDACVSDDGDCFLYGARVVYRNLTIDTKDPHVESYSMEDVTSELSLTRERLVALALLLGCDYYPAGVPGVGEIWAVKLMTSLDHVDVLKRFREWKSMTASDCLDSAESFVWRRASTLQCFPPQKVIAEFLMPKNPVLSAPPHWSRPCILKMMRLGFHYLEWPEDYSLEKTLPLATLWDQLHISAGSPVSPDGCLKPCRIMKKRVRQGVPCLEVEWENNIKGLVDERGQRRQLVTVEREDRFQACFPALVNAFLQQTALLKAEKSKRGRKGKGAKKEAEALSSQLDSLTISSPPDPADDPSHPVTRCPSPPQASSLHHLPSSDTETSTNACHKLGSGSSLAPLSSATQSKMFGTGVGCVSRVVCGVDFSVTGAEGKGNGRATDGEDRGVDFSITGAEGNGRATDSKDRGVPSPGVIDRNVEYVPLSQRLSVLTEGEKRCAERSEVIDLDDSYTYIPLSQRLKARLGSQQKVVSLGSAKSGAGEKSSGRSRASLRPSSNSGADLKSSTRPNPGVKPSVETCTNLETWVGSGADLKSSSGSGFAGIKSSARSNTSLMTRSEDNNLHTHDCTFTHTPLSQPVKNSLDSVEEVCTQSLSSQGSEMSPIKSMPRTVKAGVELTRKSEAESIVLEKENNKSKMCEVPGGIGRESGRQNTAENLTHSDRTSETCAAADHSERETAFPLQKSMPGPSSVVCEVSSNTLSDLGDNAKTIPLNANAADTDKQSAPCLTDMRNKKPSQSAQDESKRGGKKKMATCQQGRKGRLCSQRDKQTIRLNDLLQDWSVCEPVNSDGMCHTPKGAIGMNDLLQEWSDDEASDHEKNASVFVVSSDDESDQKVNTPADKSLSDCLAGKLCPAMTTDSARHPSVKTPSASSPAGQSAQSQLACLESSTPYQGSVVNTQPADSFRKLTPSSPQEGESFVSDGHFTLHHTLFASMEEFDSSKEFSRSAAEQVSEEAEAIQSPHCTFPQEENRQVSDDKLQHSLSWDQTSQLERSIQHTTDVMAVDLSKDNSFQMTHQSFAGGDPASRSLAVEENPSEEKDVCVAAATVSVSSDHNCSAASDDSKLDGSMDAECFLPLSQRLRLKQSTAKALNTITSMF